MVAGQTISHYRITDKLGEGGMGVVYKAEDTKLERTVALKFLAAHLVSDEDVRKRFEREAKAAAALNHPNICHVYEIDEADGKTFIAMAFIEGQGLDGKIAAGPLKLDEALDIAHQIAQGLQAAHAKGIVHRDIKPANVMVTGAGSQRQVTIMDFGLAQLTEHSKLTRMGETMGTVAYMSPEQTMGTEVDRRSDIWALGVALYEMITGQQPFRGHYEKAVMYSITNEEPEPMTALRTGVPMELEWIVAKCLAKEADSRYQNAGDMAVDLKNLQEKLKSGRSAILHTSTSATTVGARHAAPGGTETEIGTRAQHAVPLQPTWKRYLPWAVAAILAFALVSVASLHFREAPPPEMPPLEFTVSLPEGVLPIMFSLSPDGRHVAIATRTNEGLGPLWVRPLDSLEARALAGTAEARYPFWSPDSQSIGFFAQGKLKKVALAGGPPQSLCDAEDGRGGSWSREGVILFAPSPFGEIQRVAEGGGEPIAVTKGNESEQARSRRFPHFLPDSRHFLYSAGARDAEQPGVYLGSLAGEAPRRLLPDDTNAVYVPGPGGEPRGYLLFVREEILMARPFDAERLEFSGDVFPVAEPVVIAGSLGFYGFSASAAGTLVHVNRHVFGANSQLTWLDRQGKLLNTVGDPGAMLGVSLSPDARRAAVAMITPDARLPDIWLVEMGRNTFSRFTSQPEPESGPVWSPAGDRIAYTMVRGLRLQVYHKDAGGGGEAKPVSPNPTAPQNGILLDWSPDGRFMVVGRQGTNSRWDLWVLSVSGEEQPFPFLATEFTEIAAQFSPDGNWLAYQSDRSGRSEIYLRPFPKADREWKISTDGGGAPRWRGDGRELYFVAPGGNLMAAGVRTGETVEADVPVPLFKTNMTPDPRASTSYDVTADGQRFLVLIPSEERSQPSLTVTTNWLAKVRR